ncbi:hypothetical protein EDD86DRAFT_277836 [Gorgonomyces haynaldii]|nr:hypothetical protein EDD86DRAFT_277836 [Gorgonomyces haynaldii]
MKFAIPVNQDLILTNNINLAQKVPPPGLVLDDSISLVLKETLETTVGLLLYKQAADECIGVLCNQILYTAQYNGIAGKETKILKTIGGDDFDWTPVQAPKSELRIPIPDGSFVLETLVQEQLVCSSEKMESCLDWGCGMPISLQIQETTSTNTTLDQIRTGTVEDAVYACRMHLTLVSEHRVLIERMVVRASYWTVSTMTFIQLLQRHSVCDGCLIEPIGQQLMLFDASFAVFCSIWSILSILVFLMSYRLKR